MKCPLCNATIRDGSLYCESCGEDIHIVPDFDPTVEEAYKVTIESMAEDVIKIEKEASSAKQDIKRKSVIKKTKNKLSSKKLALIIGIPVIICSLILGFVIGSVNNFYSSFDYRYNSAKNAYLSGNYQLAAEKYAELLLEDKDNIALAEEYALSLYGAGDLEGYENQLFEIFDSSLSTIEQRNSALAKLVAIYDSRGEYDRIKELVLATKDDNIIAGYSDYFVDCPNILPDSGEYSLSQLLTIEGTEDTIIYYSIKQKNGNSNIVIADDLLFDGPVLLDNGFYEVSAYCVNDKGIKSDLITAEIDIVAIAPSAPTIIPSSGTYSTGQFIEVVEEGLGNATIYYTEDGSEPDLSSKKYEEKLLMKPGYSVYKFICINDDGLSSEIVEVHYDFNIEYSLSLEEAKLIVLQYLFEKGITISPEGTLAEGGKLAAELVDYNDIEGTNYYVLEEVSVMEDGSYAYLNVKYGVNMLSGEIIKL